jgi:hypothetical protein
MVKGEHRFHMVHEFISKEFALCEVSKVIEVFSRSF